MATLLGALESMKAKLEEDEDVKSEDTEIEAAMIALMEAEQEVEASNTEIMELDGVVEEAEEALDRLEGIRDAILEYGISKSMMKAADPKGELCAAGIVAAYESLSDTPVKDANAEAAVEGIGELIKNAASKLFEVIKKAASAIKSMMLAIKDWMSTQNHVLSVMAKVLHKTEIDEAKLKTVTVKAIPYVDFAKHAALLANVLNNSGVGEIDGVLKKIIKGADISAIISDILKAYSKFSSDSNCKKLGITFNGRVLKFDSVLPKASTETFAKHGWDSKRLAVGIKGAGDLVKSTIDLSAQLNLVQASMANIYGFATYMLTQTKSLKPSEIWRTMKEFGRLFLIVNNYLNLLYRLFHANKLLTSSIITLTRTATKHAER